MRALLWIIAIFAIAAGVAMLAGSNQGYVLLVVPPWRMQVSLNLVVVALVLALFIFHFLLRLISKTLDLPGRVGRYRARRRQQKAADAMNHAVRALYEGRFEDSLKSARLAWSAGGQRPEAALVAARAAHALNDEHRYREWIERAGQGAEGRAARALTEAEFAIERGDHAEARRLLENLREQGHRSTISKSMLLEIARTQGEWDEVVDLVGRLQSERALSSEAARALLREARLQGLRARLGNEAALVDYWRSLPRDLVTDARFLTAAVPVLAMANKGALARSQVEHILSRNWDPQLAPCYALCVSDEYEARDALIQAEKWLREHPDDAGLLYALGRQCAMAQVWGKAQSYLEASLERQPSVEAYLALAELMDKLDRPAEAGVNYRRAAQCVSPLPGAVAAGHMLPSPT